jgi:hypothetical protein
MDESKTGEAYLSAMVRTLVDAGNLHIRLFDGATPTVLHAEFEFPVPRGRVDMVAFHSDGSATVCEIKDGSRGFQHALSGIGQVLSYGLQVALSRGALTAVRTALMFSRTRSIADDILVVRACEAAGVMPVALGSVAEHKAAISDLYRGLEAGIHP